jgi:hypothetical protein
MNGAGAGDTPDFVHNVGGTGCVYNSRQNVKLTAGTGPTVVLKRVLKEGKL